MCWVIPPRSPEATVVLRIASRRLVLPWSTWPITVTIGGRGTSRAGSSSPSRPGSFVAGAATSAAVSATSAAASSGSATSYPSSVATRDAVSRSMSWLIVAKIPLLISSRMTSAGFTSSSSASSLTVIVGGSVTAALSRGSATAVGEKPPSRRGGLRGPRRPRVPLLLLAIRTLLRGR